MSVYDNQILSNIFNAYEIYCRNQKTPVLTNFPVVAHRNLHTFFNEYSSSHQSLVVFLKNVPEFNQISIDDRIRLLRNSFGFINIIHATALRPELPPSLVESIINMYGIQRANLLFQCAERIQMFAHDVVLLQIVLLIVTFSTGDIRNRIDADLDNFCADSLLIFDIQSVYVELLWKYILTKSSDEIYAVKFFDKLVQFLMYLFYVHLIIDGYINSLPHEIERMDALMQSMWPNPRRNKMVDMDH